MKKKMFVLGAAALICGAPLMAQMTANAGRTTFGLRGGVNFSTFNGEDGNGNDLDNKIATGFNVGLNAEIPVGTGSYIQPGVLFSTKGTEYQSGAEANLSYIEIPVNFVYKPMLGTGNMLLGFGPYVALGVGGKFKSSNGTESDIEFENEITTPAPGVAYFRKTDAGANLLAGYEFANKFSVQLNAQLGLVNIIPEYTALPNDDAKIKNTVFGLSLGYRF